MVIRIHDISVVDSYSVYGVRWEGLEEVIECDTRAEAENLANDTGGEVVESKTYITDWKPVTTDGESS